jgi:hypothetical protein
MKLKEKTEKKLFYTLLITSTVVTVGMSALSRIIDIYRLDTFVSISDAIELSIIIPIIINTAFIFITAIFISKPKYITLNIVIMIIYSVVGTCFNLVFFSAD